MTLGAWRASIVILVCLFAAQTLCIASPQAWIELRTPHFVVVSNASEHEARQVADQFETIRAVFREYFGTVSSNEQPIIILAARDESTLKPLLPEAWTKKGSAHRSGIYLAGLDKNYIGLRLDVSLNQSAYELYEPIYHEYVHYLTRQMIPHLPVWMVEGLAEFYGNTRIESQKVLVGTPSTTNVMILRNKTPIPVSTLFEVDNSSPYYNEENKTSIFYAESWALTHYLITRDWHQHTHRLNDFVTLLGQNTPQAEAAVRTIGDPKALQAVLGQYIYKFSFTAERLEKPKLEQGDFRVRTISEAESLAVRADFMVHDGQYAKAEGMLEASIKLDPKLAAAYESMGLAYFQQGNKAEAEKWLAQAVKLDPESYLANYYYAASLLREIEPKDDAVKNAEESLRTSIKSNPRFAPAYEALAYCLARPGSHQNLNEAREMAVKAIDQEPGDVGHRVRLVEVLMAMGRTDDAIHEATLALPLAKTPADQSAASGALEAARKFQLSQKKMKELQEAQTSAAHQGTSASAQGGVQVLSDTMGVDFNPYLKGIAKIVNENWHSLLPPALFPPIRKSGTVTIEFSILKDGTVSGMKLVGSSNDPMLERASWGSITNSAPFTPLPKEFSGQFIQLRFTYCYNDACGPQPKNPALKAPIEDVNRKLTENLANDKTAKTDLQNDITSLTKLLDAGDLDPIDDSGARYYRSAAQLRLGTLLEKEELPQDKSAAEQALSDLDRIISGKSDLSALGISIPNAQYYAGSIAWTQLHSDARAYSYWQACSDSNHAGCMLSLADAYTAGWAGVHPDRNKALELSHKVFDTGTTYTCAGARAARSIARLMYFTSATRHNNNDPVAWVQKSYGLSDQIEARPNSKGGCGGAEARIEEFLYRLARGDRKNELLGQATEHLDDESPTFAALISYFSGSIDAKTFENITATAKSESARCDVYFHALWYADITHDTALAKNYSDELSHFDQFACGSALVFAEKFRH